jgi:pimeloyl-ACP methyl ester carboxylesterase
MSITVDSRPAPHVVIYVPGWGRRPTNTAERVADLIAASLTRARPGTYRAEKARTMAPRWLKAGKTVLGPTDEPLLEVLELDYLDRLEGLDRVTGRQEASPGFLLSLYYAAGCLAKLARAWRRKDKVRNAKWQLAIGLFASVVLTTLTTATAVAALSATGWLGNVGWSARVDRTIALVTGLSAAVMWKALRPAMVQIAGDLRHAMRYFENGRYRATITQTLDNAVDALLDARGPTQVTVLAYSFGSLLAIDALYVGKDAPPSRLGEAVRQLITIGCPADTIRLYYKDHFEQRQPRLPDLPWLNVCIPADVLGSNFGHIGAHASSAKHPSPSVPVRPTQHLTYTEERLSLLKMLRLHGLWIHDGYWGAVDEASCFDLVAPALLPMDDAARCSDSPLPNGLRTALPLARTTEGGSPQEG